MANCKTNITLFEDSFKVCGDVGLDVNDLMSTPLSGLTSLKDFKDIMSSELIDVKGWKTASSYPTLRLVYDRYMNSTDYCDTVSSQFDYGDMMNFSELVGTYWVDLIEQVVPSTTIWGSTYVYGNTLWDQQKFKYRKHTLFTCETPNYNEPVVSPASGFTNEVEVISETLPNAEYYDAISGSTTGETFANVEITMCGQTTIEEPTNELPQTTCNGVGIIQTNCGSEFIGRIMDFSEPSTGDTVVISECSISVDIQNLINFDKFTYQATANISGDITGPVAYSWSNGQTTQTATGLVVGESYTVTVYDLGIEGCSATDSITIVF